MLAIYLIVTACVKELLPPICSLMCLLDDLPTGILKCLSGKKFMSIIGFQAANGICRLSSV